MATALSTDAATLYKSYVLTEFYALVASRSHARSAQRAVFCGPRLNVFQLSKQKQLTRSMNHGMQLTRKDPKGLKGVRNSRRLIFGDVLQESGRILKQYTM